MENASKAIIMAGGILISLVIISILVILFGSIGDRYKAEDDALLIKQLEEYNRQFVKYDNNKGLYGSELLSLANLADDYNKRLLNSVNEDINSKFYKESEIKITVTIYNITGTELKDNDGNVIKNKNGKILKQYSKR